MTYIYDTGTKELIISGTGAMYDYTYCGAPFNSSDVKTIVINDGVTTVGDFAFQGCTNLESISIPDSVTRIGDYSLCDCANLTSITIPDSVTYLGDKSFNGCQNLAKLPVMK